MEWYFAGALLIGTVLVLMACGVPVALAFIVADVIGALVFMGGFVGLQQLIANSTDSITVFTLVPIPLFILMGELFFHTGLAVRVFDVLDKTFTRVHGRLAYITVLGGALFATLSGSTIANTAMMGEMMVPEMTKRGYKKPMALGPILGAGGLAMIIPPSTIAVLLGSIGRIDVGQLLIAGVIPGFVMAGLYLIVILVRTRLDPEAAPAYVVEKLPWWEVGFLILTRVAPMGLVIVAVVGTMLIGVATPSEAAAFGVVAVLILAVGYRVCSWEALKKSFLGTVRISGMLLLIVIGSSTFSQLLAFSGTVTGFLELITSANLSPTVAMIAMFGVVFVMGMFMEQISIMLITLPIFMPIVSSMGLDPVWFGVIVLIGLETGLITPPFGMELFALKGVVREYASLWEIARAGLPFLAAEVATAALVLVFPVLASALLPSVTS